MPSIVPSRGDGARQHSKDAVPTSARMGAEAQTRERQLSISSGKSSSDSRASSSAGRSESSDGNGLKDYQLGDCLGKGAFGSVYRALNWGTGETVAVKQIKLVDLPKSELRVIMLEIDLLKNLDHANIVKYHGFVKSTESLYIILEYCENGSLHSICKNFGKFPENLVGLYMSQVLHGLLYLHEQGVIHRDIKGANILTTKQGLVKLADFGVATRTNGLHESSVVGTPYWMAPEVIELSGATTASDIWSLGCTVIELLDGKPPYHELQPMPALFRIVNDDHPPLPEGASPAVRDFLMQCFQKDPNLRVSAKKLLKHPWIVSARRSDSVVPTQPTKYDEAVKTVQEWNEALKSPNARSIRRHTSRVISNHPPTPRRIQPTPRIITSTPTKGKLTLAKPRESTDVFRSPEAADDNWDADFASSLSPSLLDMSHLKPQDNFGGMLSSDKLKAYASSDAPEESENWDDNFEGDLTVRSPLQLEATDPLQTIRPYFSQRADTEDIRNTAPTRSPERSRKHRMNTIQPSSPTFSHGPLQSRLGPTSQPANMFQEDTNEDYSDLIDTDDFTFEEKLEHLKRDDSFSPRLFHPSDLQSSPRRHQRHGRGINHSQKSSDDSSKDETPTHQTLSSVKIQQYAESKDDEDFSDIFDNGEDRAPNSRGSDGQDHGTLLLHSKVSNNSWLGDEEDEEDPFAELEEGFDEMDLEANIARDKYARLCTQVESLVSALKMFPSDDLLFELSEQLIDIMCESPLETKSIIIGAHGMLPILEIIDTSTHRDVIIRLLKIINWVILNDKELQENLCFVGAIPIISKFASKKYSSEIRLEAAAFVRHMYQTSTLTLQMFVSCGGLNVLVEFLEEDYEVERDLVLIGVNGIWSVFELQGPTPKNDFCRIFSRSQVLYPLSLVLNRVLDEDSEFADPIQGRIVNIFHIFSQAENNVKETVADRLVLKCVLKDLKRMSPAHQITMLKFIKNLSMLSTTLDTLQNSNAIEVLADLLSSSMKEPHFREISNQVLNTMYNLCRLSKTRQEDAALNGVIPLLQRIVKTERPLKEFALPILCDMAHSGKVGRKILWQNKGLAFYISLLADPYWQVTALDAIFIWLQEETAKVEEHLLEGGFTEEIVECFKTSKANAFENLLEPLQKLLRLSPPIAQALGRPDLFTRIVQKLRHNKAVIRLNLLRIVRSICDSCFERGLLIRKYGLFEAIEHLAEEDPAVLVRNLASELVKSSVQKENEVGRSPSKRNLSRRTSSVTPTNMSSPRLHHSSTSQYQTSLRSRPIDNGLENTRSSPLRPVYPRRELPTRASRNPPTAQGSTESSRSKLSRPSIGHRGSRSSTTNQHSSRPSLSSSPDKRHSTPATPTKSTPTSLASNARRRRQLNGDT